MAARLSRLADELRARHAERNGRVREPSPVQVRARGMGGELCGLLGGEDLAAAACVPVLDADNRCRLPDLEPRDIGQPVPLVGADVHVLVDEHAVAGLGLREECGEVRERAGRDENGGFLAEQLAAAALQLLTFSSSP